MNKIGNQSIPKNLVGNQKNRILVVSSILVAIVSIVIQYNNRSNRQAKAWEPK